MKLRKEYLIAYDIEDTPIRTRIYKQLLAYGLKSIQKSIFWGFLSVAELNAIKRLFDELLDDFDKVFITMVNMQVQKIEYSHGYNEVIFNDWEEYGHI